MGGRREEMKRGEEDGGKPAPPPLVAAPTSQVAQAAGWQCRWHAIPLKKQRWQAAVRIRLSLRAITKHSCITLFFIVCVD